MQHERNFSLHRQRQPRRDDFARRATRHDDRNARALRGEDGGALEEILPDSSHGGHKSYTLARAWAS